MNISILLTAAGLLCFLASPAQVHPSKTDTTQLVFTSDVDHFWQAFDSARTTTDSARQLQFIQELYIDRGTDGLAAFMKARDYSAPLWVHLVRRCPKFWTSIRPNTLSVKTKGAQIEKSLHHLRELYPELKPARIYFTVGALRSGGTTMNDMVLIGTEIATGDAHTDVSEFPDDWLRNVFKDQDPSETVFLNVHEYIHTQQEREGYWLLSQCIKEGSCDFMAELATGLPLHSTYLKYGRAHEEAVKQQFKRDMFLPYAQHWLYNGGQEPEKADLGYFMGYVICAAYYQKAHDKKQAIRDIIQLNYADSAAVQRFLETSGYYPDPIDKEQLQLAYAKSRPTVGKMSMRSGTDSTGFLNGDTTVDPRAQELAILFSEPMGPGVSIQYGPGGQKTYPGTKGSHFDENKRLYIMKLDLKPGQEYEFVLSGNRFMSASGYALGDLKIRFRTRKS